jgi:microcompartment protein CcmL/EutN
VLLADIHPDVVAALRGARRTAATEALGVIETETVAAIIDAADAGVKGARVRLLELRLADDIGGKAYLLFDGPVADVEAAVEIGQLAIATRDRAIARVIPQLHADMRANLEADARFRERLGRSGRSSPPRRPQASRAPASCWSSRCVGPGRLPARRSSPPTPPRWRDPASWSTS